MSANTILTTALDLQKNHTKLEIIDMARAFGWRGDHARASVLQLALYVAAKLGEGEHGQNDPQSQQGAQGDAQQGAEAPAGDGEQQGAKEGEQQPDGNDKQGEQQQPQPEQGEQQGDAQQGEQGEQGEQPQPEQGEQPEQPEQQQQPQPEQGEQPEQQSPNDAEWRAMLKASGIERPHRMLRKVYTVAVVAGLIPILIGEAGTGKTMLAEQLGQLLRVPFASISCTMGMSESQLTGWLLPVGEAGKFDYVPSPFVRSMEQQSVFLLDEIDGADANVVLMLNSLLSNGFITIPHKLENPTIRRHEKAIIILGANTTGSGADEVYSARGALDGSTVDRLYPVFVDYDESYEKSIFTLPNQKRRTRSAEWTPSDVVVDDVMMQGLYDWFKSLRKSAKRAKLGRIVSTRMAQRLVAATLAGIPVNEVKSDLLLTWTSDEKTRAGVQQ